MKFKACTVEIQFPSVQSQHSEPSENYREHWWFDKSGKCTPAFASLLDFKPNSSIPNLQSVNQCLPHKAKKHCPRCLTPKKLFLLCAHACRSRGLAGCSSHIDIYNVSVANGWWCRTLPCVCVLQQLAGIFSLKSNHPILMAKTDIWYTTQTHFITCSPITHCCWKKKVLGSAKKVQATFRRISKIFLFSFFSQLGCGQMLHVALFSTLFILTHLYLGK